MKKRMLLERLEDLIAGALDMQEKAERQIRLLQITMEQVHRECIEDVTYNETAA